MKKNICYAEKTNEGLGDALRNYLDYWFKEKLRCSPDDSLEEWIAWNIKNSEYSIAAIKTYSYLLRSLFQNNLQFRLLRQNPYIGEKPYIGPVLEDNERKAFLGFVAEKGRREISIALNIMTMTNCRPYAIVKSQYDKEEIFSWESISRDTSTVKIGGREWYGEVGEEIIKWCFDYWDFNFSNPIKPKKGQILLLTNEQNKGKLLTYHTLWHHATNLQKRAEKERIIPRLGRYGPEIVRRPNNGK